MDTVLPEWSLTGMSSDHSCVRQSVLGFTGECLAKMTNLALKESLGHPTRHSKMTNYCTTSEWTGNTQINSSLKGQTEAGS